MPRPMGFGWSLEAGVAGMRSAFLVRWVKERSGEAAGSWWRACLEGGNDVVWTSRHTPGRRAGACGVSAKLDLSLRGIKKADPPLFFPQNLLGGQSLNHAHLPLAFRTLPNDRRRGGQRCCGPCRRRYIEQGFANREQVAAPSVGHPAEVANPREALRQDVLQET